MRMLTFAQVEDVKHGLDILKKQHMSVGDLGIIGNIDTGSYTFFTLNGRGGSRVEERSFNVLMTLNPSDTNSMYQLPGVETLVQPIKNLVSKLDIERMRGNMPNMSDVDAFNISRLPPGRTMTIKKS
jgi:hypothetical protein